MCVHTFTLTNTKHHVHTNIPYITPTAIFDTIVNEYNIHEYICVCVFACLYTHIHIHTHIYKHTHTHKYTNTHTHTHTHTQTHFCCSRGICKKNTREKRSRKRVKSLAQPSHMGWLRLVGSLKLQVSFAEFHLFYRALLQKRLIILRSLLVEATPYHANELDKSWHK